MSPEPEKDLSITDLGGEHRDTVRITKKLPESEIDEARAARAAGDRAFEESRLAEAKQHYEEALAADPRNIRAHHNLAVVHLTAGEPGLAGSILDEAVRMFPEWAELHYKLGVAQLRHGDTEKAAGAFAESVSLDADHLDARFQIALLHARGAAPASKDRQRAIEELDAILDAVDRGSNYDRLDRVCFLLASFLDDFSEHRRRAIQVYRIGLEADPLFAPGHNNLGVLLMQEGQVIPALGAFKIAISLQPDYNLPYRNLARLLFDHMNPSQMAEEYAALSDEFGVEGPAVLSRLSLELIDLGRGQVYESLYTHGHRIKNLMVLAGNRLRRILRDQRDGKDVSERLDALLDEQENVFNQWVTYLRSMKPDTMSTTLVDIPPLVREAVTQILETHANRTIRFATEERVPQVKADSAMLREVVTNLILNALQATDPDQGISVQTGFDPARNSIFIEVEDNGPGIPEEDHARIFDPGYSTREQGNGYGLSISSRIVSAHRGTIRLVSRQGSGAVFRVDLPVDFELLSEEETIRWLSSSGDRSSHPIAEEFLE